jgi:acetylglutamate kinase
MKDKLTLVKIGGKVIDDPSMFRRFIQDFAALEGSKILVHGGGKIASQVSEQMNIPVKLLDGRRVTNTADLEVVTMVYAGLVNKTIVAQLSAQNCPALGLSGADGNSILAIKRPTKPIDFGWVGDIVKVNTAFIQQPLQQQITPVFCAIGHDGKGQLLNTNADTVAAEIAVAMSEYYAVSLLYCFEKNGVLQNINDATSVLPSLNFKAYQKLMAKGKIHDGMLPKLNNCFYALENQVKEVKIGTTAMLNQQETICTNLSL